MLYTTGVGLADIIVQQMVIKRVARRTLAVMIDVSPTVLDVWLENTDSMPLRALSSIAAVLEVTPAGLLRASETLSVSSIDIPRAERNGSSPMCSM